MSFDQNVKIAHTEIKCPTEKITETASSISFPNTGATGDCMGDALRKQKKDVSKFLIVINSDGTLTFKSDGWPDLKLTKKTVAVAALSGHYEGSVPFILDMNLNFPGDGTMNFDQNVKIAHTEIKCPTEKITETASSISFPNTGATGDCMGDALRKQKKDVSKFMIVINSDGSLTFKSDGWPDLKLTKKTLAVAALSGHYEGKVPFILKMNLIFPGDGTMNFDQDVKIAHQEIKCPTEKITETATSINFPNTGTTGDCMGDALRKQKKDVSKFMIVINSDGSLTFKSDGWPDLKLTKKNAGAIVV